MLLALLVAAPPLTALAGGEGGGREASNPFPEDDPENVLPPPWGDDKDAWDRLSEEERDKQYDVWLDRRDRFRALPTDIQASLTMDLDQ